MTRKIILSGVALVGIFSIPAYAGNSDQWLSRYSPPVNAEGRASGISQTDSAVTRSEAEKGKVVIKNLKAVVFVERPEAVKKKGLKASGVVGRDEAFPAPVKAAGQSYIGREMTLGDLDQLTRDIVLAFRDADIPVVNVVVPEQEVSGGVLQIVVVIGRLNQVRVEGVSPERQDSYRREISLKPNEPISEGKLLDDLRYFNRNPFRYVSAIYQPGKGYGQTDVVLQVTERKPWLVYGGVESKGDKGPLGRYRPFAGVMLHNLAGLDEVIGYQFTIGNDFDSLRSHAVSLSVPLPNRFQFQATYGHTDLKATVAAPLTQSGVNDVLGLYILAPLPHFGRLSHDLRFGAEYKSTNNTLDFGGATVSATEAVIGQAVLGYTGEMLSNFGVTRVDANTYYSPGGVFSGNSDKAFNGLRASAKSNYYYGRGTIDHRLDFFGGWRASAILTGQFASSTLLQSETLSMGGIGSVRGFMFGKRSADQGIVANFTLYTPPIALLGQQFKDMSDQLRLYAFIDHAEGSNYHTSSVDSKNLSLTGAGVGLTYDYSSNASFDIGYGWKLSETGRVTSSLNSKSDSGAMHLRAVVRY